jgi:glycosyltransferase involved in cell wall biosynthesis
MNVSVIIPVQASELREIGETVRSVLDQDYADGDIEVIVAQYGSDSPPLSTQNLPIECRDSRVTFRSVTSSSPYSARNIAAQEAHGNVLLFTEASCTADSHWVHAHVSRLRDTGASISVGHVFPAIVSSPVEMMLAYENLRDAWVFSSDHYPHYFGRPKNMAVLRSRFGSHGPFAEVMRGADSKLVQKVARELSCKEVVLAPDAIVRQKSVRSLPTFLRDRFSHGRALRVYRSAHAMPLSAEQRRELFRATCDQKSYGKVRTATLAVLLTLGVLTFRLGGTAGSLSRKMG